MEQKEILRFIIVSLKTEGAKCLFTFDKYYFICEKNTQEKYIDLCENFNAETLNISFLGDHGIDLFLYVV